MTWDGIDKRKFPRIQYKCLIKVCRMPQGHVLSTYTENMGVGGICVVLGERLELFEKVELELILRDGNLPISCIGDVVWVVKKSAFDTTDLTYDTGIEFSKLGDGDLGRIRTIVDSMA